MLLIDADADLALLVGQWLQSDDLVLLTACQPRPGAEVVIAGPAGPVDPADVDLVIVDMPFPTRERLSRLRGQLGAAAGRPLLVLSTTVFATVDGRGPAARALGADGLLSQPTTGSALRGAVQGLLSIPRSLP